MKNSKLFWRTNDQIRAARLRVIDQDGKQIGVISRDEALKQAKETGLTLVEISPTANPPVAKIVEFGKFRYKEEKKLKSQSKGRGGELKEIRFGPFMADNDFNTRLNRVKEFLAEKDKVRLVVVFTGRQMNSKKFGYELLKRVVDILGNSISVDGEPKFLGKHLIMTVSPLTKSKKVEHAQVVDRKS